LWSSLSLGRVFGGLGYPSFHQLFLEFVLFSKI